MGKRKIIGFFPGVWDLVHVGHVLAFEEAKQHCDKLIIGINEDPSIGNPNKRKPVLSLQEREIVIRAIKYVDMVICYRSEEELRQIDRDSPFDIRFMGEDHEEDIKYPTKAKIVYISRRHDYSSTALRNKIND